jgi:hypothetical protein
MGLSWLRQLFFFAAIAITGIGVAEIGIARAQAPLTGNNVTGVDCSDTGFSNAHAILAKMTDAAKRGIAKDELDTAQLFRAKNDMEGCRVHIENAVRLMK